MMSHFHILTAVVLLLSQLAILIDAEPSNEQMWSCSGPDFERTYLDCNQLGMKGVGKGCFFLEPSAPFRPCSTVCKSFLANSLDEARCTAYCPGFKEASCHLKVETTTTSSPSTTLPSTTSSVSSDEINRGNNKASAIQTSNKAHIIIGVGLGVAVAVSAIIMIVMVVRCLKTRSTKSKELDAEDNKLLKPDPPASGTREQPTYYNRETLGYANTDVNYGEGADHFTEDKPQQEPHPLFLDSKNSQDDEEMLTDIESGTKC